MNGGAGLPAGYYYPPQPSTQPQQGLAYPSAAPTPPPPSLSSFPLPHDLHVDTGAAHPSGPPQPSATGPAEKKAGSASGGAGDEEDEEGGGEMSTPGGSSRKGKGGRPRDKVWEMFDVTGSDDGAVAKCRFCEWKTDHPKAFRMRIHVAACDLVPQDKKDELAKYEEEKEQKKALKAEQAALKAEQAEAQGSGSPARPGPAKKQKRNHDGELVITAAPIQPRPAMPPAPAPRSPITCHVLDSTSGKPAPEMRVRLDRLNSTGFVLQAQGMTDDDGRCSTLLPAGTQLEVGIYKITFFTADWFLGRGIASFYPFVEIPFEVKSAAEHYHIPCLLSPYSYTTYRGS